MTGADDYDWVDGREFLRRIGWAEGRGDADLARAGPDAGCPRGSCRWSARSGRGSLRPAIVGDSLARRRALALIPPALLFILGGVYAAGWLLYGTLIQPYLFGALPLPAAVYGVLVFPFIWGLTEQMTYNGYLVPRFQVLSRSTGLAIAAVAFVWGLQHAFMPTTFDARYMVFRLLSSVPYAVFGTFLYLRLRRLLPLVIAHVLLDGASVAIGVLLPLVRA